LGGFTLEVPQSGLGMPTDNQCSGLVASVTSLQVIQLEPIQQAMIVAEHWPTWLHLKCLLHIHITHLYIHYPFEESLLEVLLLDNNAHILHNLDASCKYMTEVGFLLGVSKLS
jgi:hypothetical protein